MAKKTPKASTYRVGVTAPTDGLDRMFKNNGFDVVVLPQFDPKEDKPNIDLIAFSGGIDVSPSLYGASYHPETDTHQLSRDTSDAAYLKHYDEIPKVGVCRGAQFLCVKAGGRLYQHISQGDHSKPHKVVDHATGRYIGVTSVHHQACQIKDEWTLLATATHPSMVEGASRFVSHASFYVPEAFYIPESDALCVQFHPEYGVEECETYFLELMMRVFD